MLSWPKDEEEWLVLIFLAAALGPAGLILWLIWYRWTE